MIIYEKSGQMRAVSALKDIPSDAMITRINNAHYLTYTPDQLKKLINEKDDTATGYMLLAREVQYHTNDAPRSIRTMNDFDCLKDRITKAGDESDVIKSIGISPLEHSVSWHNVKPWLEENGYSDVLFENFIIMIPNNGAFTLNRKKRSAKLLHIPITMFDQFSLNAIGKLTATNNAVYDMYLLTPKDTTDKPDDSALVASNTLSVDQVTKALKDNNKTLVELINSDPVKQLNLELNSILKPQDKAHIEGTLTEFSGVDSTLLQLSTLITNEVNNHEHDSVYKTAYVKYAALKLLKL